MSSLSTWSEKTDFAVRITIAYGLMGVLLLMNTMAVSTPFTGEIEAPLILMAIYYWSIYRPTLVPAWLAFFAGIITDLISGVPLGLYALTFVLMQWIVSDQRRFLTGQSFFIVWLGFAVMSSILSLLQWLTFGLVNSAWPPLTMSLFSSIYGIALFPFVCIALHLTHRILPNPED